MLLIVGKSDPNPYPSVIQSKWFATEVWWNSKNYSDLVKISTSLCEVVI